MTIDAILVGSLIALALAYLASLALMRRAGKKSGCGSCTGCPPR